MKHVCFIGNSHVGAIKEGIESLQKTKSLDDISITIFGSHRATLRECSVKNGVVSSENETVRKNFEWTSGGLPEMKISEYDEIFVVAGRSFSSLWPFWAVNSTPSLHDIPPVSTDLISSILDECMKLWYYNLARDISRERLEGFVTYIGEPFISEEDPVAKYILKNLLDARPHSVERLTRLREQVSRNAAELTDGSFKIELPPAAVLEDHGLFTRHEFCRGSKRLNRNTNLEHPADDFAHMNSRYGEILVRHLLDLP